MINDYPRLKCFCKRVTTFVKGLVPNSRCSESYNRICLGIRCCIPPKKSSSKVAKSIDDNILLP